MLVGLLRLERGYDYSIARTGSGGKVRWGMPKAAVGGVMIIDYAFLGSSNVVSHDGEITHVQFVLSSLRPFGT